MRNIAEHAIVPDNDDASKHAHHARQPVVRLLLAPYWVNYHLEHHLFLFVPCFRLPEAQRILMAKGYGNRMELQPGYRAVLATGHEHPPRAGCALRRPRMDTQQHI